MKSATATFMLALATVFFAPTAPTIAQDDGGQVPAPKSSADVPKPVPGAPLGKEYVQAVGRMAYVWGWPLVNMHNR
jgi:hypothetical protein